MTSAGENSPARPRVLVPPVHHLHQGPAPPAPPPSRVVEPPAPRRLEGRHGRRQEARSPATAAPLEGDVTGVPGRRLLLLVRFVVLVEHHHGGQVGDGRPCRSARVPDDGGPRPPLGPTPSGWRATRSPARSRRGPGRGRSPPWGSSTRRLPSAAAVSTTSTWSAAEAGAGSIAGAPARPAVERVVHRRDRCGGRRRGSPRPPDPVMPSSGTTPGGRTTARPPTTRGR